MIYSKEYYKQRHPIRQQMPATFVITAIITLVGVAFHYLGVH